MSTPRPSGPELSRLPPEPIDRVARPFATFLRIEAAGGATLLVFTLAALLLSNSPWGPTFLEFWDTDVRLHVGVLEFGRSIRDWINDGLMTLFFFLVALELKREWVLGELNHPRLAALSLAAALGGMLVPAALYLLLQAGSPGQHGWGTVMATDTAFVIACLALLGSRVPQSLRVFLLSMAIIDDLGAILVMAIGYGHALVWEALALATIGVLLVRTLALLGVRSVTAYWITGAVVWAAIDASGLHATLTGVILGMMTPARRWVSDRRLYAILDRVIAHPTDEDTGSGDTKDRGTLRRATVAARETLSPVERLEFSLHPWVGFLVLPLFAFANAGVDLSIAEFASPVTLAIFIGFTIGKPLGIVSFTWLAVRAGIAVRPKELGWGLMAGGSLLAGIGFTMAIFIANLAFDASLIGAAKLGIFLASIASAATGMAVLYWLARSRAGIDED